MKNKQELAQALSENLDRVDESLLRQAHETDTAEKFHALNGKPKTVRFTKDHPITTFHRVAAVAACLAIAIGLALGGWLLAKNIPGWITPDPTNPHLTQPPGTTQIDPTDGIDPKVPPRVYISHTQVNTQLSLLSYKWTYHDGDNQITANADAVHPLQATTIPQLTYETMPATILFEAVPQKITVRCWDAKYQGDEAGYNRYEVIPTLEAHSNHCRIELKPGSYIYEVAAEWTDVHGSYGSASYVFAATVSNDGPASRDITVSSGETSISIQHEFFCYGTFCTGDGKITADGIGAMNSLNLSTDETDISAIPILPLDQELSFQLAEHGTLQRVEVFSQNADGEFVLLEDFAGTVEALSELPLGTWFVAFNVEWKDTCIHGDRETRCYDHLFILEIDHEIYTSRDITIYSGAIPFTNAIECLHWSKTYDSATGTWQKTESSGAYGYLTTPSDTLIPSIILGGDFTAELSSNGNCNGVVVYYRAESGQIVPKEDFPGTLEALFHLPKGDWYVVISVTWLSRYVRAEERYEQECYEYLFRLDNTDSDSSLVISGTCGENATWEFDPTTGTLTISGVGEMDHYKERQQPWWDYAWDITDLVIENGITTIGDHAFYLCGNLKNVTLPDSVIAIGKSAFYECKQLERIMLPSHLASIGEYAFFWCSSLTGIDIPGSVTSFGSSIFRMCDDLTHVTFGEGITEIGPAILSGCWNVQSVTLPTSLASIGNSAFSGCTQLSAIDLPDGLVNIGDCAFFDCNSLAAIDLPDGVVSIGMQAFSGCDSLTEVYIPGSVTGFGSSVFSVCTNLTSVTFGEGITEIAPFILSTCWSLQNVTIPNGVVSIGEGAFSGCKSLESIQLPASLTSLGDSAFQYCDNLRSITLPAQLTDIGPYPFNECTSLTGIWVDAANPNYSSDDRGVLFNKEKTTLITAPQAITGHYMIPDSVTTVREYAFYNCVNLTGITIADSVTTLENEAFKECTGLTEVIFGKGLTMLSFNLFESCTSLTHIAIPENITYIDCGAFFRCSNLQSITLPDSLTFIGSDAFADCTSLISIEIPAGVTSIEAQVFLSCESLQSIIIPEGVTSIGYNAFAYCKSLTDITIPNTVTSIGGGAFANCRSLVSITIPDGVTFIDGFTFENCTALTHVTIPAGITFIGDGAFAWCENLWHVLYKGTAEQWNTIDISNYSNSQLNDAIRHDSCTGDEITDLANKVCSVCLNCTHQWDEGVVIESATPTQPGLMRYTCTLCNTQKTEAIPTLAPSGTCGDDQTWELSGGVLTISGSGDMYDYSNRDVPPWREYAGEITALALPEGLTRISNSAFVGFSGITAVEIPSTVTAIGSQAFSGCAGLTTLAIPDSVQKIGSMAFNQCTNLQTVTIGTGITSIDMYAFQNCYTLMEVQFLGDMPYMEEAFYGLWLTIYYPAGNDTWDPSKVSTYETYITWVPVSDFPGGTCGNDLTWKLVDGVLTISGAGDMHDYSNQDQPPWREYAGEITALVLPDGLTRISNSAFVGLSNITELTIPSTVISIGGQAFSGCAGLTTLAIPDSVQSIADMAFHSCTNLHTVTIGTGIAWIDSYAFMLCENLSNVHFLGNMPSMGEAFVGLHLTIYYPAGNTTWDPSKVSTYETYITWVPVEMAP